MKKRCQVSIEYMALIGITTVVVTALLALSYHYSNDVEQTINTNQLDQLGKQIVDSAESVYYYGEPSKTTMRAFVPQGIRAVTISPNEVSFRVFTQSGETDMSYSSAVPLQGAISTSYGFHNIIIEAREGYVWINSS